MKEQTRKEMQRKMAECKMSAPEVSWADIEQAVGARPRAATLPLRRRLTAAAAAVALLLSGGAGLRLLYHPHPSEGPNSLVSDHARETSASAAVGSDPAISGSAVPGSAPSSSGVPGLAISGSTPSGSGVPDPAIPGSAVPGSGVSGLGVGSDFGRAADTDLEPTNSVGRGLIAKADVSEYESWSSDDPSHGDAASEPFSRQHDDSRSAGHDDDRNVWPADQPESSRAAGRSRSVTGTQLTAFMGNAMTGYSGSSSFTPMLMSAPPFGVYDEEMAGGEFVPLRGGDAKLGTDVRHHQPVRFGLTLRYGLGSRWSVESGLAVSFQKSEFTSWTGDRSVVAEQHLAYIGIPLNAGYRIWSGGGFNFYASAGGMVEKMVKGSRSSVAGENPGNAAEEIRIRPLQFSLTGALGAEYRIVPSLSLYVEPGLAYHFDNGTAVPSLYRDAPLNFNLNVGLRFAFPASAL